MKDLVIALYAFVLFYQNGSKATPEMLSAFLPVLKPKLEAIPEVLEQAKMLRSNKELDYAALAVGVSNYAKEYAADPSSRATILALLRAFASWFRSGSAGAMKTLEVNSASDAFPGWVSAGFVKEIGSQAPLVKRLSKIVERFTGKNLPAFQSLEESAAAKVQDPELYKEYLALRREFNQVWKDALSTFVRQSNKKTVPFADMEAFFNKRGIQHSMPVGFTGKIDANGKWYDSHDNKLTPPPGANMFPRVRMNTKGNGSWVAQGIGLDGTPGKMIYKVDDVRERRLQKFQNVQDFMGTVDKIRAKWLRLIHPNATKSGGVFDLHAESVAALVLELVFKFSARIGGRGETDGQTTYGMSTLLRKHYHSRQNGFTLKYPGKAGVMTTHKFVARTPQDRFIIELMEYLVAESPPNYPLFWFQRGNQFKAVTPALVNQLFKKLGAQGVTVRNLRTYHGTRIFMEEVAKIQKRYPKVSSLKQAVDLLKLAAVKVGKALNHVRRSSDGSDVVTPATALGSYIDLTKQIEFFQFYGLPLPKTLEKVGMALKMVSSVVKAEDFQKESTEKSEKPQETADDPSEDTPEVEEDEVFEDNSEELDNGFLLNILEQGGAAASYYQEEGKVSNLETRTPSI